MCHPSSQMFPTGIFPQVINTYYSQQRVSLLSIYKGYNNYNINSKDTVEDTTTTYARFFLPLLLFFFPHSATTVHYPPNSKYMLYYTGSICLLPTFSQKPTWDIIESLLLESNLPISVETLINHQRYSCSTITTPPLF